MLAAPDDPMAQVLADGVIIEALEDDPMIPAPDDVMDGTMPDYEYDRAWGVYHKPILQCTRVQSGRSHAPTARTLAHCGRVATGFVFAAGEPRPSRWVAVRPPPPGR